MSGYFAICQVPGVKLMRPDASAALVELIPAECNERRDACYVSSAMCYVNKKLAQGLQSHSHTVTQSPTTPTMSQFNQLFIFIQQSVHFYT